MAKKVAKKVAKKKTTEKKVTRVVDLVACERELRKYVKRFGGFRKGITDDDKARANQMMELLGRKELVWDKTLIPFLNEQRALI